MKPIISNISEDGSIYKFTLSGLNVSLANALRRTIMTDIPIVSFYTETYENNECNISVNTTRLHNEILKHRLSCIPVVVQDLDILPGKYILDVDVENNTDSTMFVTTEHFRIKNKETDKYLTDVEQHKIFPKCQITNMFIDFGRLRGKISDAIPGERISLTAEFSVHTAKENGMYNVVSNCAYGNTIDNMKAKTIWDEQENRLKGEGATTEEISFQKKNYYILDVQRHFIENSFDFILETIGIFENKEIVTKACIVLQNKMVQLIQSVDSDTINIHRSENTVENSFDIVLENEDYTIGKTIELMLYEKYYMTEKELSFCGFKKLHPHDNDSILRISFHENKDKTRVRELLRSACLDARVIFNTIRELF